MSTASTEPLESAVSTPKPPFSGRLMSVDALRGFDMFWIIGADALVRALDSMAPHRLIRLVSNQLKHKDWAGFAFYDLIFPLFVFIVGVSLVFSLSKAIEKEGRSAALRRVFKRGLLLLAIGIFYSGGFSTEWPNIRLLGVLNRIGLAYMGAGLVFCFFRTRGIAVITASILVGYYAVMGFVPIRNIQLESKALASLSRSRGTTNVLELFHGTTERVTGKFEKGFNVSNHFDFQYLPGKRYDIYWDPEGILSTVPAVGTCLLGVLAGLLLRSAASDPRKLQILFMGGAAAVVIGFLWGTQFPVVKKIWTSSFVLVAGGYGAILLGLFYWIVDVRGAHKWCQPFVWIGMNSITVYLANNLVGFRKLAEKFAGGDLWRFLDAHIARGAGSVVLAMVSLGLAFGFCYFLHRRRIFLRL